MLTNIEFPFDINKIINTRIIWLVVPNSDEHSTKDTSCHIHKDAPMSQVDEINTPISGRTII